MTKEELLAVLVQDAESWNAWRDDNLEVVVDLSGADLSGADLRGAFLIRANLSGADLSGANLYHANLNLARLRGEANLYGANLLGAELSDADLLGANLGDTDLRDADLSGANLSDTDLRGANLSSAKLNGAKLRGAKLNGAKLRGTDLRRANLIDAVLDAADLTDAKLWETQRGGWSIDGALCERAFWDRDSQKPREYEDGAFERAYADETPIVLTYPHGISLVELAMLPLILDRLQAEHEGSILHIRSVLNEGGGSTVIITMDDMLGRSDAVFQRDREALTSKIEGMTIALRHKTVEIRKLGKMINELKLATWPILLLEFNKNAQRQHHGEQAMAVLFLDLKGFSTMNRMEAEEAEQIVRSNATSLFKRKGGEYPNTWGDAVMAAFENPNDAFECACKLVNHLAVESLVARIGMSYGTVTMSYNEVTKTIDISGPEVNEAARLEPMAEPGEVLVSKALRFLPDVDTERFNFRVQRRVLKKDVADHKAGESIECYSVVELPLGASSS